VTRRAIRGRTGVLVGALWLAGALSAQVPQPGDGTTPVTPQPGAPQGQDPFGGSTPAPRDPLDPVWVSPPAVLPFEGFPVFPSRLSGYGNYPSLGPSLGRSVDGVPQGFPLLPLAGPEPPGWPGWLRLRQRQPLPFAEDLALLVQNSDRVWWRNEAEAAFVPLYFHDKLRTLKVGAEVQVRQAGEFELVLHSSTRFIAQGPTDVRIVALSATDVELDVRRFTRLRVQAMARDHLLRLPDGSQLRFAALPGEGETEGPVLVLLQRADEPSRYGGRATIFNAGARAVRWQYAFGESRLEPGQRLTMFLAPPATSIGSGLVPKGVESKPQGAALRCDGADGGTLSWCGARFEVGPGHSVRLEPLQGEPLARPPANGAGNQENP